MGRQHINWLISVTATSTNEEGHINQAPGDDGSENNIKPLEKACDE